jgi:hypothetical protein
LSERPTYQCLVWRAQLKERNVFNFSSEAQKKCRVENVVSLLCRNDKNCLRKSLTVVAWKGEASRSRGGHLPVRQRMSRLISSIKIKKKNVFNFLVTAICSK